MDIYGKANRVIRLSRTQNDVDRTHCRRLTESTRGQQMEKAHGKMTLFLSVGICAVSVNYKCSVHNVNRKNFSKKAGFCLCFTASTIVLR